MPAAAAGGRGRGRAGSGRSPCGRGGEPPRSVPSPLPAPNRPAEGRPRAARGVRRLTGCFVVVAPDPSFQPLIGAADATTGVANCQVIADRAWRTADRSCDEMSRHGVYVAI